MAAAGVSHVELRAIAKRFDGVQALVDASVAFARGEIHALVGENGAGKSTLGRVVSGSIAPDAGEILVDGRPVQFRSPRDAIAAGITIIDQELALEPFRTVAENVFLGSEPGRAFVLRRRELRRRFQELNARTGFDLDADAPVGGLRIAEQQKVEILRAIARDARLIVMDEPTAALTREEADKLFRVVRALSVEGTTIVYVSHFLEEVLALADTVTVLKDGRVVRSSPAGAETPASLVLAMLGRSLDVAFPEKVLPPADAPEVLSVRGVTRAGAIEDVDFAIRAGEIVGLAGLVGSGRSEVARAIFGADPLDAGTIELDGRPIRVRTPREAIRKGIALLPESRKSQGLLMARSVVENITLPHLRDVSTATAIRRRAETAVAGSLVERLGIRAPSLAAAVTTCSGGNQQKVLFAKWLVRPPRVLIADEPTRGIDVGAKHAIYQLIHGLAAEGMAVLVISSELEEVLGLAHRVLVMKRGRIVARLGHEATAEAVMRAAFATDAVEG